MTMSLEVTALPTRDGPLTALTRDASGTPLVLLHGAMADAAAWSEVARSLHPDRRLVIPNRRGRASSAPLTAKYGLDLEVEDLLQWISWVEHPVDLVAHSYGATIAVEAVRLGAPVASLTLYEPVTRPFGDRAIADLSSAVLREDLDRAVEIINVDVSGYTKTYVDALRESPGWDALRALAAPLAAELGAINAHMLEPLKLPGDTKVAMLAGELSRHRTPYGPSVDAFADALGLSHVAVIPGQDHLAHVTAPALLASMFEAELDKPR